MRILFAYFYFRLEYKNRLGWGSQIAKGREEYEILHISKKFTLLTKLCLVIVAKSIPSDCLASKIVYNLPQAIHPTELTLCMYKYAKHRINNF